MSRSNGDARSPVDPDLYLDPDQSLGWASNDPRRLAKRMLRQLIAQDPAVVQRFERLHPRYAQIRTQPRLADAQLVVARMLGYRSWPRLTHHRAQLRRCQREIDSGAPAPDGDRSTVHIRCGSDLAQGLGQAGYTGAFLEFSDPYCHGPVPSGDLDTLLDARAGFIALAYEQDQASTRARLAAQWRALAQVGRHARVVLWFEHDSYDQLILAAVLATLRPLAHPGVELVCLDRYPGRPRFRGLGELPEVSLRALWDQRRLVHDEDYALGTAVWQALRQPDPRALVELAQRGTPAIPVMAAALRRHAMELPATSDGLSLTQRLVLEIVGAHADHVGAVFRALTTTHEPLPFLGDLMFWWEIRELADGGALALRPTDEPWPRWRIALTDRGDALLRGTGDWIRDSGRTRWVGGIPCGPGHPPWRWDPVQETCRLGAAAG